MHIQKRLLLRVKVHGYIDKMSEKDGFSGQTCLPVAELRKGKCSVSRD